MKNFPRVTAVVSTWNSGEFIGECLQNLEDQSRVDALEIVVVDAASPGNEKAVVEEFQKKYSNIRYLRTERRIGVYAAWNRAIREARGEYVISTSTNDSLAPNAIEVLSGHLDQNPGDALVYGDTHLTSRPHETFDRHTRMGEMTWPEYSRESLLQTCQVGPHPMWRKSVHGEVGWFDENYLACGDQDFWLRLGRKFQLRHLPVFTGLYWVSSDSLSRKGRVPLLEAAEVRAKHLADYLQERKSLAEGLIQKGGKVQATEILRSLSPWMVSCGQMHLAHAEGCFDDGKTGEAIEILEKGIRLVPTHPGLVSTYLRICQVTGQGGKASQFLKKPEARQEGTSLLKHLMDLELMESVEVKGPPPLVSAVVSTYRGTRHIRGCLDSLMAQTLGKRLEVIVVDSASPENEGEIVREYQERFPNIRYVRTAQRETIYAAWNRGIQMACGKFITNANTDDRHAPDALEIMARELEKRNVGIVYSDTLITARENETWEKHSAHSVWRQPDFSIRQMLMYCPFGPQPMWKRELHESMGWFDPSLTIAGDYEFFIRLAWRYGAWHIPRPLGLFLLHEGSVSHADQPRLMNEVRSFLGWYRTHIPIEEIYGIPAAVSSQGIQAEAMAHFGTSLILFPFNHFSETENLYRMSMVLGGWNPQTINNLAVILHQQGRGNDAIQWLTSVAETFPMARANLERLKGGQKMELVQAPLEEKNFRMTRLLPSEESIIPVDVYWKNNPAAGSSEKQDWIPQPAIA